MSDDFECNSDPEEMENGNFFDLIQKATERAEDERHFVMNKLKSKQRVGSIFFDKVKTVLAAIQREKGKYDYLIEWEYHERDKLKPNTSMVRGSHFVFAKPLLYRLHSRLLFPFLLVRFVIFEHLVEFVELCEKLL